MSDSSNAGPGTPGVVAPPPLIYAGALSVGLLAKLLFPVVFLPRAIARALGLPLFCGGLLLGFLSFRALRRAGTNASPYEPTTRIVLEGPYRFTRNPIYLSFTLVYGGVTVLANSLWAALLLPCVLIVMRRGVIEGEERYLEGKFVEGFRTSLSQLSPGEASEGPKR